MTGKTYLLIRAESEIKCKIALSDLLIYTKIKFDGDPRQINETKADNIIVSILGKHDGSICSCAVVAKLNIEGGAAIGIVRNTHPPAHIVVVSEKMVDPYQTIDSVYSSLPAFEFKSVFSPYRRHRIENKQKT